MRAFASGLEVSGTVVTGGSQCRNVPASLPAVSGMPLCTGTPRRSRLDPAELGTCRARSIGLGQVSGRYASGKTSATCGVSNDGTEAVDGITEKARRTAHGFGNFTNYRLRILNARQGTRPYRRMSR